MMAAILAALPAVHVSFYAFSDTVIDFTERVADPLALLLEVKVGGGTRIHRALRYAREQMRVPSRSLLLLITDFEEGGSVAALQAEVRALAESGVKLLGLAALGDDAKPRYCEPIARRVVAAGMPVAALSPLELARWVGEQLRG
jgi:Mg-chelatase subunit ChlD